MPLSPPWTEPMQTQIDKLSRRFERIAQERMRGLPFYNNSLQVEALGFTAIESGYVGALITPWFINVILLFREQPSTATVVGHKYTHRLPSGDYDFMIGEDEELGRYDFISLASPTSKYKTQQQAQGFALTKLKAMLIQTGDPASLADAVEEHPLKFVPSSGPDASRRSFLTGKSTGR